MTDAPKDGIFSFRKFKIRYPLVDSALPASGNANDSTGFSIWNKALTAAVGALDSNPDLVCTRQVAEIGCGLGVLGLACRELGARAVVLTDQNEDALKLAQKTIALNKIPDCSTAVWDWGISKPPANTEFVVGSDVIFSTASAQRLAADLEELGKGFLIGHEKRRAVFRDASGAIQTEAEDGALRAFLDALPACCSVDVEDLEGECCVIKGKFQSFSSRPSRKRERSASFDAEVQRIREPRRRAVVPGSTAFSDAVAAALFHTHLDPPSPPTSLSSSLSDSSAEQSPGKDEEM